MDAGLPIAATLGEPAGVGPELVALAWRDASPNGLSPFYCIGDPGFLAARFEAAGTAAPLIEIGQPADAAAAFSAGLPVAPLKSRVQCGIAGRPAKEDAPAVIESIERAVDDVRHGRARALVTAPVQKESLYAAGFPFPGHTELLGELTRDWPGGGGAPVMMLAADELRVVPVTVHVPLVDVPRLLSEELIVSTGRIVAREMKDRLAIAAPRIAVAGLNPHAGEGGRLGREEHAIIAPAVSRLRSLGIDATGPIAADTLFHPGARERYDVALAMYHDQALIPIKTIAFDRAVNLTLGLPLVRTSPDHGTALSLAGTGRVNPSSFIAAMRLADRLSRR